MEDNNLEKLEKEYEIGFLLKEEAGLSGLKSLMSSLGFKITEEGELRKIDLAYPIKKESQGFFGYFHFIGEPEKVKEFSKDLKISKDVLRSLVLNQPIKKVIPRRMDARQTTRPEMESSRPRMSETSKKDEAVVTNEDLEKKLEEILK